MTKKEVCVGAFVQELLRTSLYKRSQGRIARQATFGALAVIVALGAWSLSQYYSGRPASIRYGMPVIAFVVGIWASFRVVHMPNFADFLISVEAEMNKVSWPSRAELVRASIVVMLLIFFLAGILFVFDLVWKWLLGGVLA